MGSLSETAALVALLRKGSRPWELYADLVEEAGSALRVLGEEKSEQQALFGEDDELSDCERLVTGWAAQGIHTVTVLAAEYPDNLRRAHDRPPLIFVAGELRPVDSRAVSLIGARAASSGGLDTARTIAEHLVDRGFTVVSGLAAGIDTAGHTAALGRGGRTIAVIGTGLRSVYPPENAALQTRIAAEGAVISQFWPDAPPTRQSFPRRNGVMSGLTLATVVVEGTQTSGARIQARLALAHGRPVFLVESLLAHKWAREFAQRPGTYVVHRPREITDAVERLTASVALTG
jgi:DNA processing protein